MDFSTPTLALIGLKRRSVEKQPELVDVIDELLRLDREHRCFQATEDPATPEPTAIINAGAEGNVDIAEAAVAAVIVVAKPEPEAEAAVCNLLSIDLWERVAVGLLLAEKLLLCEKVAVTEDFKQKIIKEANKDLEHEEPRVRSLVVSALAALTTRAMREQGSVEAGIAVYEVFRKRLTESIAANWKRESEVIADAVSGAQNVAVDDTTGWKALETSLLALKGFVETIGRPFLENGHLTEELRTFVTKGGTEHVNRHVREAAFKIMASILQAAAPLLGAEGYIPIPDALVIEESFATAITRGLQDNWSQVRYAASLANRYFLLSLEAQRREKHYPLLLPRMTLNRYYMAEGVKLYSQETWKLFMGDEGRFKVAQYAAEVAGFYVTISDADNHVVREAACHSIAEMAVKVPHDAVAPHVAKLLRALLICFNDESWPVRDAACVASGRFVSAFTEECRPELDHLFERWLHQLSDPIWSVREDSAVALGEVCRAYGDEAVQRVMAWLKKNLPKAHEQKPQTDEDAKKSQNDAKSHTDNQRYSCGSLAPKLKKGGCSDCEVSRPSAPWEYSDGAIYMIKELCAVVPDQVIPLFEEMVSVCSLTHFPQADSLRETLWKQLPAMAHSLGKKVFKRHLEVFLDCLFNTLERPSSHQLALHAAGACVLELSAFIGPCIFQGRLNDEQREIMARSPYCQQRGGPGASTGSAIEAAAMGMSMDMAGGEAEGGGSDVTSAGDVSVTLAPWATPASR